MSGHQFWLITHMIQSWTTLMAFPIAFTTQLEFPEGNPICFLWREPVSCYQPIRKQSDVIVPILYSLASLARLIFSILLSAESERLMLICFFLPMEARELSAPPASPSTSLSLSGCNVNYISRFGTFTFCNRNAVISKLSSMLWYYSSETTNKYTFWDMNWN